MRKSRIDEKLCFIAMAYVLAQRSTCARRAVGCILVNSKGHIVGSGYNGVAAGASHCINKPCPGVGYTSGKGLAECQAIHAEQNALIQCYDTQDIHSVYVTTSPCVTCLKMLGNTSAKHIYYVEAYPDIESAKAYWTRVKAADVGTDKQRTIKQVSFDKGHLKTIFKELTYGR